VAPNKMMFIVTGSDAFTDRLIFIHHRKGSTIVKKRSKQTKQFN